MRGATEQWSLQRNLREAQVALHLSKPAVSGRAVPSYLADCSVVEIGLNDMNGLFPELRKLG